MLRSTVLSKEESVFAPQVGMSESLRIHIGQVMQSLGFSANERRIYLLLVRVGPLRANELSAALLLDRKETYHLLTSLQNRGLVAATFTRPLRYAAEKFEKALDMLSRLEPERVEALKFAKRQLLRLVHDMQMVRCSTCKTPILFQGANICPQCGCKIIAELGYAL